MKQHLQELIEEMKTNRGNWNGDEGGYIQEQGNIASDIIEKAQELTNLINELNGTN